MADKLTSMSVGHDFAPGAEPSFYDLYLYWFAKVMESPAAMVSLVLLTIGFTVVLLYKIITRRRAVEEAEAKRRRPVHDEEGMDLATLRRSRQERSGAVDRTDAA
jgi:hypothetical protein